MSGESGLQPAIYVSIGAYILASYLFGFKPLTGEQMFSERDIEDRHRINEVSPGGGARAGCVMILFNGATDGLFVGATTFNVTYPLLNLLLPLTDSSWDLLRLRAPLLAISLVASYLTIMNMWRLWHLRAVKEPTDKLETPGASTRLFILRQYLAYNVSLAICWVMAADGSQPSVVNMALFLIALTIDDWNLLAKYMDLLSLGQLRRAEVLKCIVVLFLVPLLSVTALAIPGERRFLVSKLPFDAAGMILTLAILSLLVQWTLQLATAVRMVKRATRW